MTPLSDHEKSRRKLWREAVIGGLNAGPSSATVNADLVLREFDKRFLDPDKPYPDKPERVLDLSRKAVTCLTCGQHFVTSADDKVLMCSHCRTLPERRPAW